MLKDSCGMAKCISMYRYLRTLPFEEVFRMAKELSLIDDFEWGKKDSGELWVSIENNGTREVYNQWGNKATEKKFSFVATECCSRLAAYPQLLRYAENCGLKLEGSPFYGPYDFKLTSKFGGVSKTVEVKCRDVDGAKEYYMDYFVENDVMLDKPKETNATHYYTQTADGYGMLFDMRSGKPGRATTSKTTATPTDEKINKDALYFNYKDNVYNWTPWCVASKKILGLCS